MARFQEGTANLRIEGVSTPVASTDVANKAYVDDNSSSDIPFSNGGVDVDVQRIQNGTDVTYTITTDTGILVPQFTVPVDATRYPAALQNSNVDAGDDNVQSNYTETDTTSDAFIQNKPTLAPENAEANVQSNYTETDTTSDAFIQNKPTLLTLAEVQTEIGEDTAIDGSRFTFDGRGYEATIQGGPTTMTFGATTRTITGFTFTRDFAEGDILLFRVKVGPFKGQSYDHTVPAGGHLQTLTTVTHPNTLFRDTSDGAAIPTDGDVVVGDWYYADPEAWTLIATGDALDDLTLTLNSGTSNLIVRRDPDNNLAPITTSNHTIQRTETNTNAELDLVSRSGTTNVEGSIYVDRITGLLTFEDIIGNDQTFGDKQKLTVVDGVRPLTADSAEGDIWLDCETGAEYTFFSSNWVQTGGYPQEVPLTGGTGGTVLTAPQQLALEDLQQFTGDISDTLDTVAVNTTAVVAAQAQATANVTTISNNATEIQTNATAIALNTAKTGISDAQTQAIIDNTAKTGITDEQTQAITDNTAAIVLNTAKTGITDGQTQAIIDNTAAIVLNTAKETNVDTQLALVQSGTQLSIASDGNSVDVAAATNLQWGAMTDDLVIALELNTKKHSTPGGGTVVPVTLESLEDVDVRGDAVTDGNLRGAFVNHVQTDENLSAYYSNQNQGEISFLVTSGFQAVRDALTGLTAGQHLTIEFDDADPGDADADLSTVTLRVLLPVIVGSDDNEYTLEYTVVEGIANWITRATINLHPVYDYDNLSFANVIQVDLGDAIVISGGHGLIFNSDTQKWVGRAVNSPLFNWPEEFDYPFDVVNGSEWYTQPHATGRGLWRYTGTNPLAVTDIASLALFLPGNLGTGANADWTPAGLIEIDEVPDLTGFAGNIFPRRSVIYVRDFDDAGDAPGFYERGTLNFVSIGGGTPGTGAVNVIDSPSTFVDTGLFTDTRFITGSSTAFTVSGDLRRFGAEEGSTVRIIPYTGGRGGTRQPQQDVIINAIDDNALTTFTPTTDSLPGVNIESGAEIFIRFEKAETIVNELDTQFILDSDPFEGTFTPSLGIIFEEVQVFGTTPLNGRATVGGVNYFDALGFAFSTVAQFTVDTGVAVGSVLRDDFNNVQTVVTIADGSGFLGSSGVAITLDSQLQIQSGGRVDNRISLDAGPVPVPTTGYIFGDSLAVTADGTILTIETAVTTGTLEITPDADLLGYQLALIGTGSISVNLPVTQLIDGINRTGYVINTSAASLQSTGSGNPDVQVGSGIAIDQASAVNPGLANGRRHRITHIAERIGLPTQSIVVVEPAIPPFLTTANRLFAFRETVDGGTVVTSDEVIFAGFNSTVDGTTITLEPYGNGVQSTTNTNGDLEFTSSGIATMSLSLEGDLVIQGSLEAGGSLTAPGGVDVRAPLEETELLGQFTDFQIKQVSNLGGSGTKYLVFSSADASVEFMSIEEISGDIRFRQAESAILYGQTNLTP